MQQELQAIVTVLSLVNPLVCGAMFARIEGERSTHERRRDAIKVALAVVIILSGAALVGTQLLHLFGVSLDAFMVAGGGVLAWMGYSMLSGHGSSPSPSEPSGTSAPLTPLILFAASPGTITGVITLSAAHTKLGFPVTALIAIVVASALTWLAMVLVAGVAHQSVKGGFARDAATRFMGLIVISMGVQFALTGLRQFGI